MDRPEEIPEWAWDAAKDIPGVGGGHEMQGYMQSVRINAARALLKAREEAFEEAASKCGIMATNAETDEAELALYAAASAIRQHSQKGER